MSLARYIQLAVTLGWITAVLSTAASNTLVLAQSQRKPTGKQPQLANGFYGVLKRGPSSEELRPVEQDQQIVEDLRVRTWGEADPNPAFMLVKSVPDVPLELAEEPQFVKDKANGDRLNLRLSKNCVQRLARFTTRRLGTSAVLIIDRRIVMDAVIRSPLTNGELQLSFCTEGAAQRLEEKLRPAKGH